MWSFLSLATLPYYDSMRSLLLSIICLLIITSCVTDIAEINALTQDVSIDMENGSGIKILYSDSAVLKVRITSDSIVRYVDKVNPRIVFPAGVFIEFLSPNGRPTSWLEADRAVRDEKKNIFTAQGNVRFYNTKKEKLISTELIWDEDESILHTEKYVKIIQPAKGDTTQGFGFLSNEEFNIFEIKRRTSAVFKSSEFKKKFED